MMDRLIVLIALLALLAPARGWADETIVIEASRIVPPVFATTTGKRVEFVNRTQRLVHIEFTGDVRQREVIQIPATGPIWAIFHRPGTHPYVMHVYGPAATTTLEGLVEVSEDEHHKWEAPSCVATVMGVCLEP